ncbi:hypothetical protein [Methylobacterium planeticum]|uniref:Uncharacterized protein n=1 Tax=Methylobacterium planeticum TaxID=2615211 RepID=A0A6N6MJD6_9HYPH|nr:hypothetical protein [Methylobacterium planeticum]KAB1070161.1 hypothetical protein F6X51_23625 [Methylobacterium planeticum]
MQATSQWVGNRHVWPVDRAGRPFRAFTVEPGAYLPVQHGDVFRAALLALFGHNPSETTGRIARSPAIAFDLVTFPEAFLPTDDLVSLMPAIARASGSLGCIHVGLRPSVENSHLFTAIEVRRLLKALSQVPALVRSDLAAFKRWFRARHSPAPLNLGCVIARDADDALRVCLHPKAVRSRFEVDVLAENHMAEGSLLSVITLRPRDKRLPSLTLQPILCSDALDLQTDRPDAAPLVALNREASVLGEDPPDHVDVVTLATCTPQPSLDVHKGGRRNWHPEFRQAFIRAASSGGFERHHRSVFVVANFLDVLGSAGGLSGLSGLFQPTAAAIAHPNFVWTQAYGRPDQPRGAERAWRYAGEDGSMPLGWRTDGFFAALQPHSTGDGVARMFGFTLPRLPRELTPWTMPGGLTECRLLTGRVENGRIVFRKA